ncbi:DHA2 family efflux MFS transporter permease subunit [Nakamurella sp. YIM 132087]|uniref:DHA2 family efflux MFS transporter permease subunit n=1 Tax=Nakamurella alba TaxID=2665158 RepID=A0A7K1FPB9_9ACTN|nr:DHA2 family efflux MFS transporter permease subunit [Nakamurella alba]MTD15998.1 DHA2 family efflux MFS transporter permease subunit [Nakamurella alba]
MGTQELDQERTAGLSPRRWLVLIAMTGSLSMVMLDQTVVAVALPSMTRDLPLSAHGGAWVANAYVLAMAALVALGGRAGDLLGGRTTFRVGVTLFFLASAGCAFAPTGDAGQGVLIAFRALQGVGAALMVPVSAAIVMAEFPPAERGRVMAMYAGISQIFLALGPLIGGLLTEYVSWRAVFLLNVPVGIATLVLVRIARVPNVRRPAGRLSVLDIVLVVGGLGLTTVAVQQSGLWGWASPVTLTLLTAGVLATAVFVVRQLRSRDPLMQLRLFADRGFTGDAVVMALVQFGLLGMVLYSSVYLQGVLGISPAQAGVAVLPLIIPLTVAAQIGGRWFDRAGVRAPALTGLLVCAAGAVLWTLALPTLTYGWQIPGMVVMGLGLGLTLSPTNTDALARAGEDRRSQASGVVQTMRQLGGTLGVAVIGSVVVSRVHSSGLSDGSPHTTADAISAGFLCAAVAFALAAAAAAVFLQRRPLVTDQG